MMSSGAVAQEADSLLAILADPKRSKATLEDLVKRLKAAEAKELVAKDIVEKAAEVQRHLDLQAGELAEETEEFEAKCKMARAELDRAQAAFNNRTTEHAQLQQERKAEIEKASRELDIKKQNIERAVQEHNAAIQQANQEQAQRVLEHERVHGKRMHELNERAKRLNQRETELDYLQSQANALKEKSEATLAQLRAAIPAA